MKKYSRSHAKKDLPNRTRSVNKASNGKCLVIAGSTGMWGAAVLTATAASRCGSGYVFVESLDSEKTFPSLQHPDFLLHKKGTKLSTYSAVAIGPGGQSKMKIATWLKKLSGVKNVVIDAEALNVLAIRRIKLEPTWVLTPHEGELSRLLKVSSDVIRKDRKKYVILAQQKYGCIVLLKGFRTLVADGKSVTEIQSGNPSLAKAGTGDVLTGIIAGFLAQGLLPIKAACLGAFVHGHIADEWIEQNDVLSLMASDIVKRLPESLKALR